MVDKTKPVVPKSMLTRIVRGILSIENLSPNKLSAAYWADKVKW